LTVTLRLTAAAAFCTLLALLAGWLALGAAPEVQRAHALTGERWYSLKLEGQHLGYWFTRTYTNQHGQWTFESKQRSALNPTDPVTTSNRRVFAALPPHNLIEAEYQLRRKDWSQSTHIRQTANGYEAVLQQGHAEKTSTPTMLDWRYRLSDYLEYETWLYTDRPAVGSARTIATLDFSRLEIVHRKLAITSHNATGYKVENPAPFAPTTIQLDAAYAPTAVRMAGLFDLTLSTKAEALAPRSALQSASYYISLNKPLADHTRLERVELAVDASVPVNRMWPESRLRDGEWRMTLRANPLSSQSREVYRETLGFPTRNPRIVQLAARALSGVNRLSGVNSLSSVNGAANESDKVRALVTFVHNFLIYEPGKPAQPVLALLDDPVGDCTEFADLFTTLARSVGIATRTVFGLAYSSTGQPAFAFHAWNEVRIDNDWQAVDPTWNQVRVDATHLLLPTSEAAALHLLTGAVDVSFRVVEAHYFNDD
jgi:transglutaminase-like putative cysteine protease